MVDLLVINFETDFECAQYGSGGGGYSVTTCKEIHLQQNKPLL